MNQTNTMLLTLGESYGFSVDTPEQEQQLKVSGMKFQIRSYYVKGLGHVSAMIASGFFGLMKMDTLIINPTEVDMPLFSYDRVLAMGNDTLIFELYDTFLGQTDMSALDGVKTSAAYLPDYDLGEHWYDSIKLPQSLSKKGKKGHTQSFDTTATHYLVQYLATAKTAAPCDPEKKREKASVYVEGLLKNGGPSTDVFKKGIGAEKTAELFRKVLFGTSV